MEMGIAHLCGISRGFVRLSFTWRVFQHGNVFNSHTSSKLRWSSENALSSTRRHENTPFENENSWPKKCTAFEASIPTWQLMPGSKKSEVVVTSSRTSICFWLNLFDLWNCLDWCAPKWPVTFWGLQLVQYRCDHDLRTLIVQALYESLTHMKFGCVALLGHGISLAQMICQ